MITTKYSAEYASEVLTTIPYGYIDKTICGCGLTTVALENFENAIIAVPTIGLMQNKVEQYPNSRCNHNILGVWGETTSEEILNYINSNKTIKIMVVYNSLKKIEFLLKTCRLIIDESNELLSKTKSFPQEIEYLFKVAEEYKDTVSFISATPTPLSYLPKWIRTINSVKIEWENTITARPILLKRAYPYKALREEIMLPLKDGSITLGGKTFSKIIVFINSIDQILTTIKELSINKSECSIICGDNLKNDIKISGIKRYSVKNTFPKYLFITKSGFSGIDLESEDAMTIVVSNTTKRWQMIDMLTDLKQAVSRQRIKTNPNYGTYIYIYNQSVFEKSEEVLLSELTEIQKKIVLNIPHYNYLKSIGEEKNFMKDADFTSYTIFSNGEYSLNEKAFDADLYFILEIRRQYTKGFEIKSTLDPIEEIAPQVINTTTYLDIVDYFNANHDNGQIIWNIGGKREWKNLVETSYALYKMVWKNYTYAKKMNASFGDTLSQIKLDATQFFKKEMYTYQQVKDKLSKLYFKYNINRLPKITDLDELNINVEQIRLGSKRFIKIL